jgi:hypothetical protein
MERGEQGQAASQRIKDLDGNVSDAGIAFALFLSLFL